MNAFLYNDFIFSPSYRILRHVVYWSVHLTLWAIFWMIMDSPYSFGRTLLHQVFWLPVFICYSYPLVYWAVPRLLLEGKVLLFLALILAWGAMGLYINFAFRTYVFVPLQYALGFEEVSMRGMRVHSYLCMIISTASPTIIKLFKLWTIKQRDFMMAQQEKAVAELQLLKAQIHPHFLFNTLNNIYAYSLENSPKTPEMVLKLSSLLSYMLYDCKVGEVLLEKEVRIMKDYLDLEKERYGDRIDISWTVFGDVKDKMIAPLLILPFLENALKHGASEQIDNPWLSVDISVRNNILRCKVANSKNEYLPHNEHGIGVNNVRKRLALLYPESHELKMSDEGSFFVVSMTIALLGYTSPELPFVESSASPQPVPA